MSIEIIRYKPMSKGTLLGFADLFIPKMGIEIYGCALHQKNGKRWLNMPSREVMSDNGEKKYFAHVRFKDSGHFEAFQEAAKKAIDEWCRNNLQEDIAEQEEIPF